MGISGVNSDVVAGYGAISTPVQETTLSNTSISSASENITGKALPSAVVTLSSEAMDTLTKAVQDKYFPVRY